MKAKLVHLTDYNGWDYMSRIVMDVFEDYPDDGVDKVSNNYTPVNENGIDYLHKHGYPKLEVEDFTRAWNDYILYPEWHERFDTIKTVINGV